MKKIILILSTVLIISIIAACSSNKPSEQDVEKEAAPKDKAKDSINIAMVIPGKIDDNGFMEAGYRGLMEIKEELGAEVSYKSGVEPELKPITNAIKELAKNDPDMMIIHGGQGAEAAVTIAGDYPDIEFVVTQGHVKGKNLSSYEVLQEESAYLAGAAAGLLTESGKVGHMAGIRFIPGLKSRAAFADGLKKTNPKAELITSFIGDQDAADLSEQYAEAQIEQGADIIFTMLNTGRTGATEVIRAKGMKEIGNVKDHVAEEPDVFIASAVADSGMAAFIAAERYKEGNYKPNVIEQFNLEDEAAVRLSLASDVPKDVKKQIEELKQDLLEGKIKIDLNYEGPEFTLEEE